MASASSSKLAEPTNNGKWQVSYIYHTPLFKEEFSSNKPLPYVGEIIVYETFQYEVCLITHDISEKVTTIYLKLV